MPHYFWERHGQGWYSMKYANGERRFLHFGKDGWHEVRDGFQTVCPDCGEAVPKSLSCLLSID